MGHGKKVRTSALSLCTAGYLEPLKALPLVKSGLVSSIGLITEDMEEKITEALRVTQQPWAPGC